VLFLERGFHFLALGLQRLDVLEDVVAPGFRAVQVCGDFLDDPVLVVERPFLLVQRDFAVLDLVLVVLEGSFALLELLVV